MWGREGKEGFDVGTSLCPGSQLLLLFPVEDVDLDLLRRREDIKQDKKAFLNDSEWELLSVSSTYNILQNSAGDFAQIRFHVGPSPSCPCCSLLCNLWLSLLLWGISVLLHILIHCHPRIADSDGSGHPLAFCQIRGQRFSHRSWISAIDTPHMNIKRMVFRPQRPEPPTSAGILKLFFSTC